MPALTGWSLSLPALPALKVLGFTRGNDEHYTSEGLKSEGVMAVSHQECTDQILPVEVDSEPFPEHVMIDFSAHEKKQIEKISKRLKVKAERRGWLFRQGEHG